MKAIANIVDNLLLKSEKFSCHCGGANFIVGLSLWDLW
jgi:hypothetical protein